MNNELLSMTSILFLIILKDIHFLKFYVRKGKTEKRV